MDVMAGTSRRTASRMLALGGAGAVCGAAAGGSARRVGQLVATGAAARVDEMVELGVLGAGSLVLAWLTASALLAAGCLAARGAGRTWRRGEAWVHRFAPAVVRRALVVAVAAGLGAGGVGAAAATDVPPTTSPGAAATVPAEGAAVDLGWVVTATAAPSGEPTAAASPASTAAASASPTTAAPTPTPPDIGRPPTGADRAASPAPTATRTPAGAAAPSAAPGTPAADTSPQQAGASVPADAPPMPDEADAPAAVTVAPGDTLWGIAARHLPAGATDAQIAAAWPAWYAANAATIGPDPDLIVPGQMLVVPRQVLAVTAEATR